LVQGVLELMETINIVRVEGDAPKTAREAEFAAKLATLAGLGGLAAEKVAEAASDAGNAVSSAADAAGHAVLDGTSAAFHCVSHHLTARHQTERFGHQLAPAGSCAACHVHTG
jgi:hypothetical protein